MFKLAQFVLVMLVMLVGCAPTIRDAGAEDAFKLEGQILVLDMSAPIAHGEGAVLGKVSSRFCAGEITPKPRVCPQRESGWTALDIPYMEEYPARLEVGRVLTPVKEEFFDVALAGGRATLRAEFAP